MPDAYELIYQAEKLANDCKCPCVWGDVVSPAISYGPKENQFSLVCIDCRRSTKLHTMRTEKDVIRITKAWQKACAA